MQITGCSIVVSTYNRLPYLKNCLASLLDLDFYNYEIIVIDDGSTDGTGEYLDGLKEERIKVFHNERNLGLSLGRDKGIELSRYDIIAFTDDDCQADRFWLSRLTERFADDRVGLAIGQVFYRAQNYRGYFPERLVSNPQAKWPMGCNIAYRKKVFSQVGNFDPAYFFYNNEDSEMAIRAISGGWSFYRVPEAIIYHQPIDWTIASLLRSARNASVWPLLKKKYPRHYLVFGPPIKFGFLVNGRDYLYLLLSPVLVPVLLIRYLAHGKKDLKIFFAKWPVYLFRRRYYLYREAIRNRIWML